MDTGKNMQWECIGNQTATQLMLPQSGGLHKAQIICHNMNEYGKPVENAHYNLFLKLSCKKLIWWCVY